jgi:hypothetical protein
MKYEHGKLGNLINRFNPQTGTFDKNFRYKPKTKESKSPRDKMYSKYKKTIKNTYDRMKKAQGGPIDTYPNVEDPEALEQSQMSDAETEENYMQYVMEDILSQDEISYLQGIVSQDEQLGMIIQKLIVSATEFSGEGPVEGPGTGVSDSIPARLSDGEFVFTDKATETIGEENLQTMMDNAERLYDGGYVDSDQGNRLADEINQLMLKSNKMPSSQET